MGLKSEAASPHNSDDVLIVSAGGGMGVGLRSSSRRRPTAGGQSACISRTFVGHESHQPLQLIPANPYTEAVGVIVGVLSIGRVLRYRVS